MSTSIFFNFFHNIQSKCVLLLFNSLQNIDQSSIVRKSFSIILYKAGVNTLPQLVPINGSDFVEKHIRNLQCLVFLQYFVTMCIHGHLLKVRFPS